MKDLMVKCEYCGKSYKVVKEHDACPFCGSYNEFDYDYLIQKRKEANHNGNFGRLILKIAIGIGVGIFSIALIGWASYFFLLGGYYDYTDDYEDREWIDYEFEYSEDLINEPNAYLGKKGNSKEDYSKSVTIYGSFDDLYNNIYPNIYKNQFSSFESVLNSNIKITKEDSNFYIDQIEIFNGSYNYATAVLHIDSNGGFKAKEIEIYFLEGDRRDRYTPDDWEETTLKDVFNKEYKNGLYGKITTSNFRIYDTIEIIIDGETYSYPLSYEDASCLIRYMGLEDSVDLTNNTSSNNSSSEEVTN